MLSQKQRCHSVWVEEPTLSQLYFADGEIVCVCACESNCARTCGSQRLTEIWVIALHLMALTESGFFSAILLDWVASEPHPQHWNYKCIPSCLFFWMLGSELRLSCLYSKHFNPRRHLTSSIPNAFSDKHTHTKFQVLLVKNENST